MKNAVCDFCSGPMPTWTVLCNGIDANVNGLVIIRQSEDWGACVHCVRLVEKRDIIGLAERAAEAHGSSKEIYIPMYEMIFDSIRSIKEDGLETAL